MNDDGRSHIRLENQDLVFTSSALRKQSLWTATVSFALVFTFKSTGIIFLNVIGLYHTCLFLTSYFVFKHFQHSTGQLHSSSPVVSQEFKVS